MDLKGKVVIVTGASSGIGRELSVQLGAKGSAVVLAARNVAALNDAAAAIRASGGRAIAVQVDVSSRRDVERLVRRCVEHFGRPDVLVNNAGISQAVGTLMDSDEADVRATMDVNFMGSVYGVWAAVPQMAPGGLIVFVTSIVGKRGVARNAAYCASKFATQGMAEALRTELRAAGIHVLTVCPPGVDTPFFNNNRRGGAKAYRLHPVDKIAALIVRAIEKGKREALLTMDAKLLHWANVLAPWLVDWFVARNKGLAERDGGGSSGGRGAANDVART